MIKPYKKDKLNSGNTETIERYIGFEIYSKSFWYAISSNIHAH